jgi:Na+/H+-dicarboxylate symporter
MLFAAAGKGIEVFKALGWYALTVAIGLSIHAFVTLPLILFVLGRRSPWEYFQSMSPALLTAFSTASSNGTLPLTLTCVEKRAKISNRISSFVLPLGATINMDGTALYEAVAVLFIAQVTGNDLSLAQQVIVAVTALLASIGAAGIPHAGTVMMVVVLSAVGLPIDYVGLILAVDRVLDMYRTSINVWSDSTACAVVARFERAESDPTFPKAGHPSRAKCQG